MKLTEKLDRMLRRISHPSKKMVACGKIKGGALRIAIDSDHFDRASRLKNKHKQKEARNG